MTESSPESSFATTFHLTDSHNQALVDALLEKGRMLCISGQFAEIPPHLSHIARLELTPEQAILFEILQLYPGAWQSYFHDSQRLQRANTLLELAQVLDSKLARAWVWEIMQHLQNSLLLHHAALHSTAMAVELFEQCDRKRDAFNIKVSRCLIMISCEMYREVIEMSEQLLSEREHLDPIALCNILRSAASAHYFIGTESDNQDSETCLLKALDLHQEVLRIANNFQIPKFELISHTNIAIVNACLGRAEPTTYHLLKIEGMQVDAKNVSPHWIFWIRFCDTLLLCQSKEFEKGWLQLQQLELELQSLDLNAAAVHDSVLRKLIMFGRRWGHLDIALDASLRLADLNSKRRRQLSKTLSATVEDIMAMPKLLHKNQQLSQHGHQLETSLARQNAELNTTLERLQAEATIRKKAEYALYQAHAKLEQQIQSRTQELEAAMDIVMRQEKQLALGRLVVGIAHEMNTPLGNALMAASTMEDYCQQLLHELNGTTLKRSQLQQSLQALSQGNQLLNHALETASSLVQRFRALAIEQHSESIEEFELSKLCLRFLEDWRRKCQEKQVHLEIDLTPDLIMHSYPNALCQVLDQVLDNALTHGLQNTDQQDHASHILFKLKAVGQEIHIDISDNGSGIDESHLKRLFEPFFSRQLGHGGMGLGLSIVDSLIKDLLRGQIKISNREGGGTLVEIHVPRVCPTSPLTNH